MSSSLMQNEILLFCTLTIFFNNFWSFFCNKKKVDSCILVINVSSYDSTIIQFGLVTAGFKFVCNLYISKLFQRINFWQKTKYLKSHSLMASCSFKDFLTLLCHIKMPFLPLNSYIVSQKCKPPPFFAWRHLCLFL